MNTELLGALAQIEDEDVFLSTDPEILDFTNKDRSAKLLISSRKVRIVIPLPKDNKKLLELLSSLGVSLEKAGVKLSFRKFLGN